MANYKSMFEKQPTDGELAEIKKTLQSENPFSDWENYYWGAKCLCTFDTENFDARLSIQAMNAAIKYGLTYRLNKSLYLDAVKVLATLNSQIGRYDVVLNYLNTVLELDPSVPDWVYHDFVSAEIHTDNLKRILKRPAMFLSDLGRNDSNSDAIKMKQKNIFKDFLIEAVRFMKDCPGCEVNLSALCEAAEKYSLIESEGWKAFVQATKGQFVETVIPIIEEKPIGDSIASTLAAPAAPVNNDRPLIVSLFPEEDIPSKPQPIIDPELEKKYSDVLTRLETTEAELEKNRKEAEEKEQLIEELNAQNKKLQEVTQSGIATQQGLRQQISTTAAELEKKRKEAEGKSQLIDDLNAQNKKLRETAQSGIVAQQGLQTKITNAETEIVTLKAEIERLKAESKKTFEQVQGDPKADIIGHIHIYQRTTQIALTKWLNHNLPMCSSNWWEECVIDSLSYEQRERAHEEQYTTLEQFDLAALLRITKKCWNRLKSNAGLYLSSADHDCLQKMWDLRNKWAHLNAGLPAAPEIKEDLYTIADFMTQVHCSKETVKEVNDYARQIVKMKL